VVEPPDICEAIELAPVFCIRRFTMAILETYAAAGRGDVEPWLSQLVALSP